MLLLAQAQTFSPKWHWQQQVEALLGAESMSHLATSSLELQLHHHVSRAEAALTVKRAAGRDVLLGCGSHPLLALLTRPQVGLGGSHMASLASVIH